MSEQPTVQDGSRQERIDQTLLVHDNVLEFKLKHSSPNLRPTDVVAAEREALASAVSQETEAQPKTLEEQIADAEQQISNIIAVRAHVTSESNREAA